MTTHKKMVARDNTEILKRIDVLHMIGALSPGGAERNLYYLAPYLARSKRSYGICCLTGRGEFADEIEGTGIPVFDLGYRRRRLFQTVLRLRRLLRHADVGVLHTHLFECGLVGRLAAWMARTPVIITHEHGKTLWKKWYHRWFERLALRWTDLRIAVSQDILNLRMRTEATPAAKIRLVFNAVDPAQFEVGPEVRRAKRSELGLDDHTVIGTVGRLVDAKSYDLLLDVAREVCDRRPEVRFMLVGEGPLAEAIGRKRQSLQLEEKFLLLGPRTDIPELMAAMDLYVISSKREGLPLALIEAMMSAKAIVSTSVGGIPDTLTHSCDGVLVEPGDRTALVDALLGLMDNRSRMEALGQNARKTAIERYSPGHVLGELEAIYDEFLKKKGISRGR